MSVLKSKRELAKTQFLENLRVIEDEVSAWCESQSRKHDNYGLADFANDIRQAHLHAVLANQKYISFKEDVDFRRGHFDYAIGYLQMFNIELDRIKKSNRFHLSNTKVKRWMDLERKTRNQIAAIKKSDSKRRKDLKSRDEVESEED